MQEKQIMPIQQPYIKFYTSVLHSSSVSGFFFVFVWGGGLEENELMLTIALK